MPLYDIAKEILQRVYPDAVIRPQPSTDWLGEFPLPVPVVEYFSKLGPVAVEIAGYGNSYFLPSLTHLWAFQAGYRYHPKTNERFTGWDDDWLVIAEEGGDPFIFSRKSGIVIHAFHGDGVWEPEEMFASLSEMAVTFAILGEIVVSAGQSLTDDDSMILEKYRNEAQSRVAEYTGSDRALSVLSDLGWD
jgi:hypothetical protein